MTAINGPGAPERAAPQPAKMAERERAEWDAWIGHHKTLFALDRDSDTATLAAWADELHREGIAPQEARAASDMLLREPPRFKSEHFFAVRRIVLGLRQAKAPPERTLGESCAICHGAGAFAAPHPERDGFCDLLCPCDLPARGEAKYERIGPRDYRARRPDWRGYLAGWYGRLARRAPLLKNAIARLESVVAGVLEGER